MAGRTWRLTKPRYDVQPRSFMLCCLRASNEAINGGADVNGINAEGMGGLQREACHACLLKTTGRDQHEQRRT